MKGLVFALLGLGAVVAAALMIQVRTNQNLREEIMALRREQTTKPREASAQAQAAAIAVEAVSQREAAARRNFQEELAKLREEMTALRDEVKQIAVAKNPVSAAADASALRLVPPEQWKDAGNASATAAMETFYWAALNGELETLASSILFPDEDRTAAQAWFDRLPEVVRQKYGSAEKLLGLLMAKDAGPLTGMQMLGERKVSETDVVVRIRFGTDDGTVDETDYLMRHAPEGWRLVVPAEAIDYFGRHLRPVN